MAGGVEWMAEGLKLPLLPTLHAYTALLNTRSRCLELEPLKFSLWSGMHSESRERVLGCRAAVPLGCQHPAASLGAAF